jgi:hypothetical protein
MHLTQEEITAFDKSSENISVDEFRDQKSAALLEILRNRHGLTDRLKSAS